MKTPLGARIRESTEEERAATAARHATQEELQAPVREQGHGSRFPLLPPVLGAEAGAWKSSSYSASVGSWRDSNSTGSTSSTERSADPQWPTASDSRIGAAVRSKLAMDALERKDYKLLAFITQAASSTIDLPLMHQPGVPRTPDTPTNPHGSAPNSNNSNSRRTGTRTSIQAEHSNTRTRCMESAPTNRRNTLRRPVSSGNPVLSKVLAHGWGTLSEGHCVDTKEVKSREQRTNEKLMDEARMKTELEGRISELESKSAWPSGSTSAWTEVLQLRSWEPPGLASRKVTESVHGGCSLRADSDSVALLQSTKFSADSTSTPDAPAAGPASGVEWEVQKSKSHGRTAPALEHKDGVSHAKYWNGNHDALNANASSMHDEDELETLHEPIHHAASSEASHPSDEQVLFQSLSQSQSLSWSLSFFFVSQYRDMSHIQKKMYGENVG